ncbi:hypothetical protein [Streptococcus intermedius]|jgi:V-type sodium ATP synthase, chain E|uniref:hypothetical protein n=1 Tax=Streptococcus intermedius TaxID=1338 RepID=UPI000C856E14|nr:hypothetical protein [Streptococcus intermedius]PMR63971.1 hypothetical protein C1I61_05950 [Streptococcus intermedius]RSJ13935.1 V-type ATP synthase subunit E [Streptococcus intermedius]WOI92078.1 hypothetical protein RYQ61_04610 [Streptococcus intermedius]
MGFESQLRDSVLEQAHENGRQLVAKAQETLDRETKEQKARLKQEKMQQREQEVKVLKRQVQREVQQLENEKRQSTLATKQRILKELFAGAYEQMAAWSLKQEQAFLEQILKKYPQEELVLTFGSRTFGKYSAVQLEQLLERYPQVKLASSVVSGEAGFLLSRGNVDDNYLYRYLVDSLWQEESYRIAQAIFQDKEE